MVSDYYYNRFHRFSDITVQGNVALFFPETAQNTDAAQPEMI